jgi:unsaturated rhamnogalacturonyl hydrolase
MSTTRIIPRVPPEHRRAPAAAARWPGARLGYLDARYRQVAERGFGGLLANLVRENADGTVSLINIVQASGLGGDRRSDGSYRDGSYARYVSEPVVTDDYKGVGPFILAALELGR